MNDSQSLSRTKWNCKYNIELTPKFKNQAIYLKLKTILEKFLSKRLEVQANNMPLQGEKNACCAGGLGCFLRVFSFSILKRYNSYILSGNVPECA